MEYTKSDFAEDFKEIIPEGFSFEYGLGTFIWIRNYADRRTSIQFSVRESADGGFFISQITAYIYYPEVERILEAFKISEEYLYTIQKTLRFGSFLPNELMEHSIVSKESFKKWSHNLLQVLSEEFYSFLDDFSSIELMSNKFDEKEIYLWSAHIQNSIIYHKIALIQKLARHPSFSKNLMLFKNILTEHSVNDLSDLKSLKKFEKLFEDGLQMA